MSHIKLPPLEKDVPKSYPPPISYSALATYSPLGQKIQYQLNDILASTCGRPTGLDTPSPYCHILSHIPLPPPPLTVDVVYGRSQSQMFRIPTS